MITSVHIQNFTCLLDTKVELAPFTVLIGPNDSGKTSFLDAMFFLGQTVERPLQDVFKSVANDRQQNALQSLVWRRENSRAITWRIHGDCVQPFDYELQLPVEGDQYSERLRIAEREIFQVSESNVTAAAHIDLRAFPQQSPHGSRILPEGNRTLLRSLCQREQKKRRSPRRTEGRHGTPNGLGSVEWVGDALSSTQEYRLVPEVMRSSAIAESEPSLTMSGDNLASVLNALLTGPDRGAVVEMEEKLHAAIPTIRGVSTPATKDGNGSKRNIEFALSGTSRPPVTIPSSQASDGAMLLTAFLALAYGDTPQILLIEEPENGLHPSRLQMVIDILRKMSLGEIGNQARQVILTTHSPLLLNFVRPEEVRIFRRNADGATEATPMHQLPGIERLTREYAPGELWYLFGEEELVRGPQA